MLAAAKLEVHVAQGRVSSELRGKDLTELQRFNEKIPFCYIFTFFGAVARSKLNLTTCVHYISLSIRIRLAGICFEPLTTVCFGRPTLITYRQRVVSFVLRKVVETMARCGHWMLVASTPRAGKKPVALGWVSDLALRVSFSVGSGQFQPPLGGGEAGAEGRMLP